MQRLIRSFNTLPDDLRELLQEQFPDGIDNSHIRSVSTPKGETLRVIELRTPTAIYLIKVNAESRQEMDQFLEQDDNEGGRDADDNEEGLEGADSIEGADEEEEEETEDTPPADDGEDDDED